MLILKDGHKRYGSGPLILRGITLEVGQGEIVAVVGPSGSGKTTILNLIGGLTKLTSGSISWPDDVRIGWIPQRAVALWRRSALSNVRAAGECAGLPRAAAAKAAVLLLEDLGIAATADRRVDSLSGGEMQRVSVAMALMCQPTLLLADEPTGHLDHVTTTLVLRRVFGVLRSGGIGGVLATHDSHVANSCDRVLRVERGRMCDERDFG